MAKTETYRDADGANTTGGEAEDILLSQSSAASLEVTTSGRGITSGLGWGRRELARMVLVVSGIRQPVERETV